MKYSEYAVMSVTSKFCSAQFKSFLKKEKKYAYKTVTLCMMDDYKNYCYPRDHESSETLS